MGAAINTGGKLEPPVPMAVRRVPLVPLAGHVLSRREGEGCRQQWLRDGEKCPALGDGGTGERVVPPTTTAGQGERERECVGTANSGCETGQRGFVLRTSYLHFT